MMHKIITFVLPIALVACASGPQESTPAATSAASTAKAERPEVKVGDRWVFEGRAAWGLKTKWEQVWVVTSVDQVGIKGTENGQPLALTLDMNEIESPRRKDSDLRRLSFPLEVGKQWSYKTDFIINDPNFGAQGQSKASVTVVGYEKLREPAGEFDVFKLQAKWTWVSPPYTGDGHATYWYAPAARAIVKFEYHSQGTPDTTTELAEFQLQP